MHRETNQGSHQEVVEAANQQCLGSWAYILSVCQSHSEYCEYP